MIVKGGANKSLHQAVPREGRGAENIAANFLANGRPLFNEKAYKLLVDQGKKDKADRYHYNDAEDDPRPVGPEGPGNLDRQVDPALQRSLRSLGNRVRSTSPAGRPDPTGDDRASRRRSRLRRLARSRPPAFLLVGLFFVPLAVMLVFSFWSTNERASTSSRSGPSRTTSTSSRTRRTSGPC